VLLGAFSDVAPAYALGAGALWDGTWPLLVALALAAGALLLRLRGPAVPEGDLVVPVGWTARLAVVMLRRVPQPATWLVGTPSLPHGEGALRRAEADLQPGQRGGLMAALLVLLLALAIGS
jgi:hydrogenase-4 component B